jgi:BolA family transcriptional regulator, general stress-responsive regulator
MAAWDAYRVIHNAEFAETFPRACRMTTVAETMRRKLTEALAPAHLVIIDESHRHAGHAGARPEGETHFRIEIVSAAFAGLSRIGRQRLVHRVLASELAGRVHALSLATHTPGEAAR